MVKKSRNNQERMMRILKIFQQQEPNPKTELNYRNDYELVVAVILSAQCTDKRVNAISPELFKSYPDYPSLSLAGEDAIYEKIKTCSYPNNKAKHLSGMALAVCNYYSGLLPRTADELQKIPGIGRKTAHVITSVLYGDANLAVDTHVFRVSERIGISAGAKNPKECEERVRPLIPNELVHHAHHWLILHGRYTCTARAPKCDICKINRYCDFYSLKNK